MTKTVDKATAAPGENVTFTICIFNRSGAAVPIQQITDTFPNTWEYVTCSATGGLGCTQDGSVTGGIVSWGTGSTYQLADGADLTLTVTGRYPAAQPVVCNDAADYAIAFADGRPDQFGAAAACLAVQ